MQLSGQADTIAGDSLHEQFRSIEAGGARMAFGESQSPAQMSPSLAMAATLATLAVMITLPTCK